MMRRFFALTALALCACPSTPPDPAANLRRPSGLTIVPRAPDSTSSGNPLVRSDVFVADSEAEGVRVLQYEGANFPAFLPAPVVLSNITVSTPGYPVAVAAAPNTASVRPYAIAPGQSVIHALHLPQATVGESPAARVSSDTIQRRLGTVVITSGVDDFLAIDPLSPIPGTDQSLPVVSLLDAASLGDVDLEAFSLVAAVAIGERAAESGCPGGGEPPAMTSASADVVDTRLLLGLERNGPPGNGGLLVVMDVRSVFTPTANASFAFADCDFEFDAVETLGVGYADGAESSPVALEIGISPRDLTRITATSTLSGTVSSTASSDGTYLVVDAAGSSTVAQIRVSGLHDPPELSLVGLASIGGSAFRALPYGDGGAVVVRSDRSAIDALDCRNGPCRAVDAVFDSPYLEDDERGRQPPGVLVLRETPSDAAAIAADKDSLLLRGRLTRGVVEAYDGTPGEGGDPGPGILALAHRDATVSFVVGPIDALRVATTEGEPGNVNSTSLLLRTAPEPRVEEVFERTLIIETVETGNVEGQPAEPVVLQDRRTEVVGLCRRDQRVEQLNEERNRQIAPEPPVDIAVPRCRENFSVRTGDTSVEAIPRWVDNRYIGPDTEGTFVQSQNCPAIRAKPVAADTRYRASFRGALFRARSQQLPVASVGPGTTSGSTQIVFEIPPTIDLLEDFKVRPRSPEGPGDMVSLFLNCRTPDDDDPEELERIRLELGFFEGSDGGPGELVAVDRNSFTVEVPNQFEEAEFVDTSRSCFRQDSLNDDLSVNEACPIFPPTVRDTPSLLPGDINATAGLLEACVSLVAARDQATTAFRGQRELLLFHLEIHPRDDESVLTVETLDGTVQRVVARSPVLDPSEIVFPDELPLSFTWRTAEPTDVFRCDIRAGDARPGQAGTDTPFELENGVPNPDGIGQACMRNSECGSGRSCVGSGSDCPGQCALDCTTFGNCFVSYRQRQCDAVEIQVNSAEPVIQFVGVVDGGRPLAAVPDSGTYVPVRRGFLFSFPGSRSIQEVLLRSDGLSVRSID